MFYSLQYADVACHRLDPRSIWDILLCVLKSKAESNYKRQVIEGINVTYAMDFEMWSNSGLKLHVLKGYVYVIIHIEFYT